MIKIKIHIIISYFLDKAFSHLSFNLVIFIHPLLLTGCGKTSEGKINFSEEFIIEGTHEFQIKGNKMTIHVDGWEDFDSVKLKKAD